MSVGKILISIARFGWKKIIKPAAVEYGPEIVAEVVRRRGERTPDAYHANGRSRQGQSEGSPEDGGGQGIAD